MDNIMEGLLETYLFETNSLLEQLDERLINAEKSASFTEDDVHEIFRAMHTIKGSSAMLEFQSLMEVAHHIEDLFFYIREHGMDTLTTPHKSELFDLMFISMDKLREEVSKVENNEPLEKDISDFVNKINSFLQKLQGHEDTPTNLSPVIQTCMQKQDSIKDVFESKFCWCVQIFFEPDCGMENLRSLMVVTSLKEEEFAFDFFPKDIESNSQTCQTIIDNGFFLAFSTEENARTAIKRLKTIGSLRSYQLIANTPQKESHISSQETHSGNPQNTGKTISPSNTPLAPTKQNLISVNLSKLDQLMALVGEIVITESMVISSPELQNVKLDSFLKSARQLRKLTDDLQDISMSLRMVSVSGVFQKMNRVVRDMRKTLNKEVRLTITGEDTEVDKTIVDRISDPIMHIVRNAMDHGIEDTSQERLDTGKDAQAEIILSASHTGSEVIISVEDDGKGMDTDSILAKASRKGLLTKPEEEYSKREILSLLMIPGFSTNTQVTEFSGRGVGLDVVKKNMEAIGGIISITSEKGVGSCTTLKIPLTLAIVDGMEMSIGEHIFTLPIANIRQSFKATNDDIILDPSGHEMIKCMNDFFPVIRIRDLFQMSCGFTNIEDGILVWVETSDKSYCMFVDHLVGEQQVVVKPFPSYLNNFNIKNFGISGCTILGNGNISIILDALNIYTATQQILSL